MIKEVTLFDFQGTLYETRQEAEAAENRWKILEMIHSFTYEGEFAAERFIYHLKIDEEARELFIEIITDPTTWNYV